MTIVILIYASLSLVIGGAVATYMGRCQISLLDRADGRGKFPSPKMGLGEVIFFGLFVALLWPLLAAAAIVDAWREQ